MDKESLQKSLIGFLVVCVIALLASLAVAFMLFPAGGPPGSEKHHENGKIASMVLGGMSAATILALIGVSYGM